MLSKCNVAMTGRSSNSIFRILSMLKPPNIQIIPSNSGATRLNGHFALCVARQNSSKYDGENSSRRQEYHRPTGKAEMNPLTEEKPEIAMQALWEEKECP